jgi:hypothetical protein
MAWESAETSRGGTRHARGRSSGMPPTVVAMHGRARAIASTSALGRPSVSDGSTKRSAACSRARTSTGSEIWPVSSTELPNPSRPASARYVSWFAPPPMIVTRILWSACDASCATAASRTSCPLYVTSWLPTVTSCHTPVADRAAKSRGSGEKASGARRTLEADTCGTPCRTGYLS